MRIITSDYLGAAPAYSNTALAWDMEACYDRGSTFWPTIVVLTWRAGVLKLRNYPIPNIASLGFTL